jgi:ubiquinone/menaquinone biosynthesis C-methylase UbiE
MRERAFRSRLLAQTLAAGAPARVLDLGTGTGSFAIQLAHAAPTSEIMGLDPDPRALAIAKGKDPLRRIDWVRGEASKLPFRENSFDAITCSLMLHHLRTPEKLLALTECLRVLGPGGELQIADWGAPSDPVMWLLFCSIRLLDGFERTRSNAAGELPELIEQAGFEQVRITGRLRTCWGSLQLFSALANKPSASKAASL